MVIWSQIWISDHSSTYISIAHRDIFRDLLAFLIHSPAAFHRTQWNDEGANLLFGMIWQTTGWQHKDAIWRVYCGKLLHAYIESVQLWMCN